MKILTIISLLALALASSTRAQDDNTLIDVNATASGLPDGTVVDTLTNPGSAGDFTTLIGQIELTSHPANANLGALVQGLAFNDDEWTRDDAHAPATQEAG